MFSLDALFGLIGVANQLGNFVNELMKSLDDTKAKAKEHLGEDVDVEVVLLKDSDGKAKVGIIVDLPGDVEEPLWMLANAFGLHIRKVQVQ